MRIVIKAIERMGPNGDRDKQVHKYYDYHIHVIKKKGSKPNRYNRVHIVEGFDHFWDCIRIEQEVKNEVNAYAKRLAYSLGARIVGLLK